MSKSDKPPSMLLLVDQDPEALRALLDQLENRSEGEVRLLHVRSGGVLLDDSSVPSRPSVRAREAASPARPSRLSAVRPEHLYKFAGLLFLFALLYRYFPEVTHVLLIAFAASILAVALNGLVRLIPGQRRWVAALLGLLVLALLGIGLWFGVPALITQARGFIAELPHLEEQFQSQTSWLREQTGLRLDLVDRQIDYYVQRFLRGLSGAEVLGQARGLLEYLALPLIVLFGALYAVGKPNERLLSPLIRAVPRQRRGAFRRMFELLGTRILGWIRGALLSMLIVGTLSTLAFYLVGLRYALLLGLWAGLAEFVPILGPIVGGLTAVIAAFLQEPQKALWTVLAVLAIQQLESNMITPLVMASVAKVHPFVTLFALMLFGSLFGFLGVLLALPLVLVIWTVVEVLWVERALDAEDDRITPVVEE